MMFLIFKIFGGLYLLGVGLALWRTFNSKILLLMALIAGIALLLSIIM